MERGYPQIDLDKVPTPCYVVDLRRLQRNLEILADVKNRTGCRILLALKGFAMFSVFPLLRQYLDGVCASSPHEARLGREEFGGEVHVFAAAYSDTDIKELISVADHLTFNSLSQWQLHKPVVSQHNIQCGLRVNPEHSEGHTPIYDPCRPGSRLGILAKDMQADLLDNISGLHFHTLCEHNSDALARTLPVFEEKFGRYLNRMEWINFGGGHHITREDYDIDLLCELIIDFKKKYDVEVYLEPGEAIALEAGILVTTVLDVVHNEQDIAILDTSAAAHMPDVLEMPYRPDIAGAGEPGELTHTCQLAGHSCLAGDIIGDYSFDRKLKRGDKLAFLDMAHYTMVKNTTFNGLQLPSIAIYNSEADDLIMVRRFGYEDFKNRLS